MKTPLAIVCLVSLAAGCAPEPPAPPEPSPSPGLATVEPGVLTVCTYTGFAPVSSKNESGEIVGTDITFVRHFAEENGLAVKFKEADFAGIWERPGRGECDLAAAGIAPLDSRKSPGVVWSAPYFNVQRTLLIRKADARIWAAAGSIPLYQRPQLTAVRKSLVNVGAFGFQTPVYEDMGFLEKGAKVSASPSQK